jgi:hypothetical protein
MRLRKVLLFSTPGHGRDDAHLVVGGDGRGQLLEITNVFIVDININKSAELGAIKEPLADGGILGAEMAQNLAHTGTGRFNTIQAPGVGAKRSGYSHDWHGLILFE